MNADQHPADPTAETQDYAQRREFVRRSVLRANRAVGVILAVVVLLGIVLVSFISQAQRNQARAETAEAEATEKVWRASLAQARAENLSTKAGHREAALEAVRTAARIRSSPELRNEAIAALGQRDLVLEREWPLQPGAYGYVFDPDLKYFATRYREDTVSLYRMEDHSHVRDFPMPFIYRRGTHVGDFTFSSTGRYLIIRYNGGGLVQWEVETGKLVRILSADPRMAKYSWPLSFSADDRFMGCHMTGTAGTQFVYDLEKGEVMETPSHPPEVKYASGNNPTRLSPDGRSVAVFSGAALIIFDATTGAERYRTTGSSFVQMISWDRNGERLAYSCDNQTIYLWTPATGRTVQLGGTAQLPWRQDFSPDGSLLITGGQDGVTRLWDTDSARLLTELTGAMGPALSRDGRRLAGGEAGKSVSLWRLEEPAAVSIFRGKWGYRTTVWQLDMTPDGKTAIWSPPWWSENHGMEILNLEQGTSRAIETPRHYLAGLRPGHPQFWRTGAGSMDFFPLPSGDESQPGQPVQPVLSIPLPPGCRGANVAFSAKGQHFVVAGPGRKLTAFDFQDPGKPVTMEPLFQTIDASTQGPASATGGGSVVMSPDGSRAAAGYNVDGGQPVIWDTRTGKAIHRLDSGPSLLTWSPDGRYLAAAGNTHVHLYSTADWSLLWKRARDSQLTYLGSTSFSGDSSLIACTMSGSRLELFSPSGESQAVWNLKELKFIANTRFTADGQKLIAGGMEGRIATLDLGTLRSRLRELQLDWPLPAASSPGPAAAASAADTWRTALPALLPVIFAAVLGVLVLRRQGRLTAEFVEATEVASQRERELAAEREVSELKSRFVTTVSHEFRTPLGITMSAVELLRHYEDRLPQAEKTQLFNDIHSATRNMAELMEQVLVLGRVDAGKLPYKPAPLDLDNLARKLTDESLSATNRKCPILWSMENDLSGAHADEALLRHIFTNLVSNAVKYSPDGAPVHFKARREGLMAVFTVQDSGIGIPEADLPSLFEAFHRASNVGDIPGTGLGLVISKRCAELHGGSIQVKSRPGEGTTFTVRIPAWA